MRMRGEVAERGSVSWRAAACLMLVIGAMSALTGSAVAADLESEAPGYSPNYRPYGPGYGPGYGPPPPDYYRPYRYPPRASGEAPPDEPPPHYGHRYAPYAWNDAPPPDRRESWGDRDRREAWGKRDRREPWANEDDRPGWYRNPQAPYRGQPYGPYAERPPAGIPGWSRHAWENYPPEAPDDMVAEDEPRPHYPWGRRPW
jgi:hypothetical protein